MARSAAFARIRADVLAIMRSVPAGAVVTYADIGAHLDVMPRHIAYILATLPDPAAVGVDPAQAVALDAAEGQAVVRVADLPHGVPQQRRPS